MTIDKDIFIDMDPTFDSKVKLRMENILKLKANEALELQQKS